MENKLNKKLGLLGGVGPQATQALYGHIINLAQEEYGAKNNDDYPQIVIESVPVPDFISDTKNIEVAKGMLVNALRNLEKSGATTFAIASNTVHLLFDELQEEVEIEGISMIEAVMKECEKRNFKKVGILASPVTLKYKIYSRKLQTKGIETIRPQKKEMQIIDEIIRYVLASKDNGKERANYIKIIDNMFRRGADGIILGCTELPLAINYEALGGKVVNSMKVLASALVHYYY